MNRIIDLSQWNTVTDWDTVKPNVDAVIIRAGFTYSKNGYLCVDNKYSEYRRACKTRNIPYSLYWFTNAITEEEAAREAAFVAFECRDMARYALPVFVDSEIVGGGGRADDLDIETRTKCVRAFCSALQREGVPAGIYCNANWIGNHIDRANLPFSFWIAHWGVERPQYDDYLLWQYTNKGTVPGISGYVDMSTDEHVYGAVEKIIALALSEVGYLEKKSGTHAYLYNKTANAGSANYTKYGYEMHVLYPKVMDYPAAWCMCFISWLFVELFGLDEARRMLCGDIDDYTITAASRFISANRWYTTPQKGDLVFFKGSNGIIGHVGYVYDVDGAKIYTVEGNTSTAAGVVANGGGVQTKSYALSYTRIAGYGRPIYEQAA